MFDLVLNTVSRGINLVQFKVGEILFPILEPFCRILENRNSEARKYFQQALKSLKNRNFNVALLNLNMVLRLHPNHFLALVYRARIYVWEKRLQIAAHDYILASQTSRFRFIHYDLYREYFISMNWNYGDMNVPLVKNFNQVYEIMRLRENLSQDFLHLDSQVLDNPEDNGNSFDDFEEEIPIEGAVFTEEEQTKFSGLKPITRKEIEATDWEILSKKLSSKTREP